MSDATSDDELPLPTHPTNSKAPSALRKRSRESWTSTNSSDPIYFSSDDLAEASVDNYVSPRRKKQYRRKWWEEESSGTMRHDALKRASKRAKDSGVFMSSDSNSSTSEEGFNLEPIKTKLQHNTRSRFDASTRPPLPPAKKVVPHPDRLARQRIQHCLDNDVETVDLSGCALASLSSDTLRPLRDLIRRPKSHFPQGEESYESLSPALKIFLYSNMLTSLPREIVNLENLNVLSVRNNRLKELPQSLGKLRSLVELNVALNDLTSLPWELLSLVDRTDQLINLHVRPNPLLSPLPSNRGPFLFPLLYAMDGPTHFENTEGHTWMNNSGSQWKDSEGYMSGSTQDTTDNDQLSQWLRLIAETYFASWRNLDAARASRRSPEADRELLPKLEQARRSPIYIGSSAINYLDIDGSVLLSGRQATFTPKADNGILQVSSQPVRHDLPTSATPSLFELCLRRASQVPELPTLQDYLPDETPEAVFRGLEAAEQAVEEQGLQCSVCKQEYVIPRAKWIEYWHCGQGAQTFHLEQLFLPFRRTACSWACAGRVFTEREMAEVERQRVLATWSHGR